MRGVCAASVSMSHLAGHLSEDTTLQLDTTLLLAHSSADFLLSSIPLLGAQMQHAHRFGFNLRGPFW